MLAGVQESKIGNVVCFGELLRLGQLRSAIVASHNDRSVEVLVSARAQVVQDANNEVARCFLAECVQILSVALLKETNCLILHNGDHLVLIVLT